jgi:ankyrin repeat protein
MITKKQLRLAALASVSALAISGCNGERSTPPRSTATATPAAGAERKQVDPVAAAQTNSLLVAAGNGDTEAVKALLDKGVDVNSTAPDGRTALIDASYNGKTEMVKLLLEHKADPNMKKADGATAIGFARGKKYVEIVDLLRKAGAKE